MKTLVLIFLLLAILSGPGCLGLGGSKAVSVETDDERIVRLSAEVVRMIEAEKLKEKEQTEITAELAQETNDVQKPEMKMPRKKSFGIEDVMPSSRFIAFMADSATIMRLDIKQFGKLTKRSDPDNWHLKVYANYDFDEVVNYLRHFE